MRPDVNRERIEEKRKPSQGAGRHGETPGSNKQQITFRVTHFIFQLHYIVKREGRDREVEETWRGS